MPCRCRGNKATKAADVASRACAYGIPGEVVDGMDVLAVRGAVAKAAERRPAAVKALRLIEAKTYRWFGHSHSDPRAYRTRQEEAEWKERRSNHGHERQPAVVKMLTDGEFESLEKCHGCQAG